MTIIMFDWVAWLGLVGGLIALLWTDSRVGSRPLRLAATSFLVLTLVPWITPSILWALVPPECELNVCFMPSPWSSVIMYGFNVAHWLAFFGTSAWVIAAFTGRRRSGV